MKEFLSSRNLEFEVKNVHTDEDAQNDMIEMGFSAIPVTKIGENPPILGANFQQIESALKA